MWFLEATFTPHLSELHHHKMVLPDDKKVPQVRFYCIAKKCAETTSEWTSLCTQAALCYSSSCETNSWHLALAVMIDELNLDNK